MDAPDPILDAQTSILGDPGFVFVHPGTNSGQISIQNRSETIQNPIELSVDHPTGSLQPACFVSLGTLIWGRSVFAQQSK